VTNGPVAQAARGEHPPPGLRKSIDDCRDCPGWPQPREPVVIGNVGHFLRIAVFKQPVVDSSWALCVCRCAMQSIKRFPSNWLGKTDRCAWRMDAIQNRPRVNRPREKVSQCRPPMPGAKAHKQAPCSTGTTSPQRPARWQAGNLPRRGAGCQHSPNLPNPPITGAHLSLVTGSGMRFQHRS
jgi:hypothetical protein